MTEAAYESTSYDEANPDMPPLARVVVMTSENPGVLSKRFEFDKKTRTVIKESCGNIKCATYQVQTVPNPQAFADLLQELSSRQATTYGLPVDGTVTGEIVCKGMGDGMTRTRNNFAFPAGPAWMMFDIDMKGISFDQIKEHFRTVIPGFDDAPAVFKHSSSSFIYKDDECLIGEGGKRVYLLVKDGQDIVRAAKAIGDRLKINGTLHYEVSKSGSLLERCLIDEAVYQPERLDFSGECWLKKPLRQERPNPKIQNNDAEPYDTTASIADLSDDEKKTLTNMRPAEKEKVKDKVIEIRGKWADERVKEHEKRQGSPLSQEEKKAVREKFVHTAESCKLHEDFILHAQNGRQVTVGELLANPDIWDKAKFADPLEPDYQNDRRIAMAFLKNVNKPYIRSFAHGGQSYELLKTFCALLYQAGKLPDLVSESMALLKKEQSIYQRGGELVRVSGGRIYELTEPWIQNCLEKRITFQKIDKRQKSPLPVTINCPSEIPKRIIASVGEWPFDELKGIIHLPIMRMDGSILCDLGYDPDTRLILVKAPEEDYWDNTSDNPTVPEIKNALERLWEPFHLFPYKGPVDIGVLLAAIFTIPTRTILPTAPAFLFRAPTMGSGKTFLAQAVAAMAGAPYTVNGWPDQQAEQRKSLVSMLSRKPGVLIFDNLEHTWNSPDLAAILTGEVYSDRLLGVSQMIEVSTASIFLATGNNVIAAGDMARRTLVCDIDPQTERPDERSFGFKPEELVNDNLEQMRMDALTVMKGFVSAGRPRCKSRSFGSFEAWDALVGQLVCWIAENDYFPVPVADPLDSIRSNYAEDPNTSKMRAFVMSWYDEFGDDAQTVADAINIATLENRRYLHFNGEPSDFSASMYEIGGRGGQIVANILGSWLSRNKGRIIDGYKIERDKLRSGRQTWKVIRVDGGAGGSSGPDITPQEKIDNHKQDTIITDTKKHTHQDPPGPPTSNPAESSTDETISDYSKDFSL